LASQKKHSSKRTNGKGSARKRPLTIAAALLANKTNECGGVAGAIKALAEGYGVSVKTSTFYGWISGFGAPNGNPSLSPCKKFLEAPTRSHVNDWLGITDDSWWWLLLDSTHLQHKEHKDPFDMLAFRPPEYL
jgi:hypothetical protein|tara:strand:+ start:212 stop:610 length:399 start_codon:yes stop_codon:yes gene_type:complete